MITRQRNSEQICKDALYMARKKAEQGCLPCVKSYLELAKQHGATEKELLLAMDNVAVTPDKSVSRRNLLKLALGIAAGLTISFPELFPAPAQAESSFWGTDTTTPTCCGVPQHFYLGRLGIGTSTGDTGGFRTDVAQDAGSNRTYAYWGLEGPDQSPGGNFYSWGLQQGRTAVNEWTNNPNGTSIGGRTIFGRIRRENPGWSSNQSNNQSVLQGFLDGVQNGNHTPGVYVSPQIWQAFFGSGYTTNQTFVLWITGCQTCVVSCTPCDNSCMNTISQVKHLLSSVSQISLGGSQTVVWQYWVSSCGCGFYDVATQNPSDGFTSVAGPAYQCTGCGAGAGDCV